MAEQKRELVIRPSSVALWTGILAGPFAFAANFEIRYALVDYICKNRAQWLSWVIALLMLLVCAYGAFSAWRGMAGEGPERRVKFMGIGGLILSTAFALFIVATLVPDLFLRACE